MTKLIKMYGERNTNTNYMSKLIQLNLNAKEIPGVIPPIIMKLQNVLPGRELVRDIYFYLTYGKYLGWKHTCVKSQDALNKYQLVNSNLVFLTITKNPYSWLLSLYRRPYHQYYSDNPSFETFLQRQWKTIGRDNVKTILTSPIELWNIKNKSYLQLDSKNSTNVTTEEIFENPEGVIQRLSQKHCIERKCERFFNYESSTKDRSKNSAFYREYYISEKWRDDLSNEAIAIINESIDRELVSHFGYDLLL
jgi:hypothetical protein